MEKYLRVLKEYWGYDVFRPLQDEIIQSVGAEKDTLGLMPTGGGKSITFQVPSMAMEGLCLVITPLIALMRDQVENLEKRRIRAMAIYSGMTSHEIDVALDNCIYGNYKFLYISPERLNTEIFQVRVQKMKVNLIAVDEAHCISQWGYDFRPAYLNIAQLRDFFPQIPVLALTATATPEVVDDIMDKLKFREKKVLKKSFERQNLAYIVRETEDKQKHLLKIMDNVKGTGIVYVRNRKKTRELALFLKKNGISSDYYHAGLTTEARSEKQTRWKSGEIRVIISTNAFGMGIDKPDVRFVVHYDPPDSLEAYFQEAGRAGRDERKAYAVFLYHPSDLVQLDKRVDYSFPEIKLIKQIYQALGSFLQIPYGGGKNYQMDFQIGDFAAQYKFSIIQIHSALKILQTEGYMELTDELDNPSKVHFIVNRDDLYKFQVENVTFDSFIKLLLRSYEGLFTEYVSIDESVLAGRAGVNIEVVYQYLNKLDAFHVIKYIPRRKSPFIVFYEERLDDKSLFISSKNYQFRKERMSQRLNAVKKYITNNQVCRSRQLLSYFGEKSSAMCGMCDVCQMSNETGLKEFEFHEIKYDIEHLLSEGDFHLETLGEWLHHKEEKTLKVIRWMLDHDLIAYNEENQLTMK